MRRCLLIILFSLYGLSVSVMAQTASVLDRLYEEMDSKAASLQYEFTFIASGVKTLGDGTLTTQDDAYLMNGNGLKILCDGKSVFLMDEHAKEVIVENVSQGADAYMANPALLFIKLRDVFSISSSSKGNSQIIYSLSPKVSCGVTQGSLVLSASGEVPVFLSGTFTFSSGEKLDVKIKSMTFMSKKSLTHYSIDISTLDSSWVVTDLR